ncbi:MAG TPA: hypothetical protein VHQ90_12205 [Thermoanaerobaculia bacterium]|nr:hypothetical protein [Thermoanaerobaculia bacterium]
MARGRDTRGGRRGDEGYEGPEDEPRTVVTLVLPKTVARDLLYGLNLALGGAYDKKPWKKKKY